MSACSVGARQELVRDVPDQDVCERELLLVLDHRGRLATDQIAALELVEHAIDVWIRAQRE